MSSFLPTDYELPQSGSKYMKLSEGENVFRILSPAITGWEYWEGSGQDRKPIRVRTKDEVPEKYLNTKDWQQRANHFWAFVVWNRNAEEVQILELKQKELMRAIKGFVENKKWGDPTHYDLTITKAKTGSDAKDVEYTVIPDPKEVLDPDIFEYYKNLGVNLKALYDGTDPFGGEVSKATVQEDEVEEESEPEEAETSELDEATDFGNLDFGDLDNPEPAKPVAPKKKK